MAPLPHILQTHNLLRKVRVSALRNAKYVISTLNILKLERSTQIRSGQRKVTHRQPRKQSRSLEESAAALSCLKEEAWKDGRGS